MRGIRPVLATLTAMSLSPAALAQDCVGEEVCDGVDNDCDTVVDDDIPGTGLACGTDIGECEPGVTLCEATLSPPAIICHGAVEPTPECCDGLDNDCNGLVDDGLPLGDPCGTDVGECSEGRYYCDGCDLVCVGEVSPRPEVCDGLDNDCDGVNDDDVECPGGQFCVEGICTSTCGSWEDAPCPADLCCIRGFCLPDGCEEMECDDPCAQACLCMECHHRCDLHPCPEPEECEIVDCEPVCSGPADDTEPDPDAEADAGPPEDIVAMGTGGCAGCSLSGSCQPGILLLVSLLLGLAGLIRRWW